MTYCYHYLYPYYYSYYYHYWLYCFIIITIFYFCYSHHYYCSQYYQCFFLLYLILFLIVHITMTFISVLRVTCMCPFLAIIVYFIIVIITTILFFSALPVIGRELSNWIRAAWSSPTHWLIWVYRRVSNIFIFILFFFGDYRWGVDVLFHIYHMTSFNYDANGARDVGLSCRCHLSNSQVICSV